METVLIDNLIGDGDTTGAAHLKADDSEHFYVPTYGYKRAAVMMTVSNHPPIPTAVWPLYFRQYFDKNYEYGKCGDDFTDTRGPQVYKTVCIGDQEWMAHDLNYSTGSSWCYDNDPDNCDSLGRLYNWQTAMSACPQGWHLPTKAEWQTLIDELGGSSVAGGKLKSLTGWNAPNTGATNSSEFSALGSGWYNLTAGFGNMGLNVVYWTATEVDATTANGVLLSNSSASANFTAFADKTSGYSCRCIKDQ